MKKLAPPLILTVVLAIATVGFFLAVRLTPVVASSQAVSVDALLTALLVIAAAIFALVMGFFIYSLVAFRRRPGDTQDAGGSKGNNTLEMVWTVIPLVIVLGIGVYSTNVLVANTAPPSGEQELEVKVTAFQWAWKFEYPQFGLTSGELVLPVDRPVLLLLTSTDVNHSFFVPEFRIKMDALPGIENKLRVTPTKLGAYQVLCTEMCGTGHAAMTAPLKVVDAAAFEQWVKAQPSTLTAQAGPQLTGPEAGRQISQQTGCIACHSIDGSKLVGPTWQGLAGSDVTLADGSIVAADDAYLKESITAPAATIVQGYANLMPGAYAQQLTEQQISDIVEYIKTLK